MRVSPGRVVARAAAEGWLASGRGATTGAINSPSVLVARPHQLAGGRAGCDDARCRVPAATAPFCCDLAANTSKPAVPIATAHATHSARRVGMMGDGYSHHGTAYGIVAGHGSIA